MAVLGLAYFVGMVPLQLPAAWRSADPRIRWGRLGYAAAGILFVFYLVYAEAIIIKAICLWCTAVHGLTLLLFVLTGFATALSYPDGSYRDADLEVDEAEGAER